MGHLLELEKVDVNDWLRDACDASIRGETSKICSCFECELNPSSFGLDDPLLCSPPRVQNALEHIFSSSSETLSTQSIHPQQVFRAILMIPPSYEAPWQAACDLVDKSLHQKVGRLSNILARDDKALLSLVTEIQSFFHQTVAVWWELERRLTAGHMLITKKPAAAATENNLREGNTTPRQMLMRLAKIVMSPLVSRLDTSDPPSRDNRRWTLPLELLATIVSLFRDLEESNENNLVTHILGVVFDNDLQPTCLLPWMTVVSDLRHNLRESDWSCLQKLLFRSITCQHQQSKSMSIDVADLPGLARAIVSLISTNHGKGAGFGQGDVPRTWQALILHLLKMASANEATFSTVETVLQSSFAALPPSMLRKWLLGVTGNEGDEESLIPNWVKVHFILLVSQASYQSGSHLISHLVSKAMGSSGDDGCDVSTVCWANLVALALSEPQSMASSKGRRRIRFDPQAAVDEVRGIFDELRYSRQGQVVRPMPDGQEEIILSLTKASILLRESVYLGSVSSRAERPSYYIFAAERAQWWVQVANKAVLQAARIAHREAAPSLFDMLLAVIVIVTVYCEIPTSRSALVRSFLKAFSVDNNVAPDLTSKLLHCTILSVIVRSLTRNDDASNAAGLGALKALTSVFAQPISRYIFCPLALALAPLPLARTSLLTFARKCLHAAPRSCDHHFWWAEGGSSERRDRIECGFYALCSILAHGSRGSLGDDGGLEAWKMLSDFIVLGRPSLPCAERSILFSCLLSFVKQKRLNVNCCKHVLRACLVTLCTYCCDSNGCIVIVPELAFATWADAKQSSQTRVVKREDLVVLLRLTSALQSFICADNEEQSRAIQRERQSLLISMLAHHNVGTLESFSIEKLDHKNTLESVATMCIVESLLRNVIKDGLTFSGKVAPPQESVVNILTTKLLDAERDELNVLGLDWTVDDQVPTWLCDVSLWNRSLPQVRTIDASFIAPVQSSFCDLLLEVVLNPNWPLRKSMEIGNRDELKADLIACSFVVYQKLKRRKIVLGIGDADASKVFDDETFCCIASSCIRSSARFLKTAVRANQDFFETELVVGLALQVCDAINGMKTDSYEMFERNELDVDGLLIAVWDLYLVIASEEGARCFIGYFEEIVVKQKCTPLKNATRFLGRVETADDVDELMRNVRISLLRALLQCTSLSTIRRLRASVRVSGLENLTTATGESGKTERIKTCCSAEFLSSALVTLCSDLRFGLEGKSGGLTNHSYLAYIDSIERMVSLICDEVDVSAENKCSRSVQAACRQGASIIEDILCSFPLRGAILFKSSLRLALIKLPSIARSIGREQNLGFVDFSLTSMGESWPTYGFANNIFGQCMDVHARWTFERMNQTTPWFEIAGPQHCSSLSAAEVLVTEHEGKPSPTNALTHKDIPAVIAIPSDQNGVTILENERSNVGGKIQLPFKECWSWACSFSLSAMDGTWTESLKVMMRKNAAGPADKSINRWASYLAARREELSSILRTIRLAFQQSETMDESWIRRSMKSTKERPEMFLTLSMPSCTKLRLCALLGRIAVVLRRSIRVIHSSIRASLAVSSDDDAEINFRVVEALSSLSAWLFDNLDGFDFVTLTRRWFRSEKLMNEASQKFNALYTGEDPVLRRFPKVLCRVEELESAIRALYQMLSPLKDDKLRAIDELLKCSWEPSWDYDAKTNDITIRDLVSKKISGIWKSGNQYSIEDDLPRSEATARSGRKRRKMLRVHNRRVVRSRNALVDNWLQLDQGIDDEGFDDDAFVELEDFLVDG